MAAKSSKMKRLINLVRQERDGKCPAIASKTLARKKGTVVFLLSLFLIIN
jgi:hypothetical protein